MVPGVSGGAPGLRTALARSPAPPCVVRSLDRYFSIQTEEMNRELL